MLKEMRQGNPRQEILGGLTSFFAVSYVIIVNSMILSEAGMPAELTVFGTIFISVIGCLSVGLIGNAPLVITTGMGVNSFFTYTLVIGLGLTWQQALAVSFISGLVYFLLTLTAITEKLNKAIPDSLKHGITVGIGLFLVFVGLENGKIITRGEQTFMELNSLLKPEVLLTLGALVLTLWLFFRGVQGSFLIGIIVTTIIANVLGLVDVSASSFSLSSLKEYPQMIGQLDFSSFFSVEFFLGVFSLTMILLFESIGLINGLLPKVSKQQFKKVSLVNGMVMMLSSVLGTSPTIPAAESSTGIQGGAKFGLMSVVSGILFSISLLAVPLLAYIPGSAISPVIIITGCLMMSNLKFIDLDDLTEWFPSFIMIVIMGFAMSISDGLAFGFVSYPLVKVFSRKSKDVSTSMWITAALFMMYLLAKAWL